MTPASLQSRFEAAAELLELGGSPCVGVALSGGADSVALLLMGHDAGWEITALHCNFHLRGAESDRDQAFVEDLCTRRGIPLLTIDFDVAERRRLTGESVEMACRNLRYDWFASQAKALNFSAIALGHHADDNIETSLLNALRGSGIRGIRGMLPRRDIYIRPMLSFTRVEIEEYLRGRESFITDSTNLDSEFRRNRLRNKVLPTLYSEFPDARRPLTATLSYLRDDSALLASLVAEKAELYTVYSENSGNSGNSGNSDNSEDSEDSEHPENSQPYQYSRPAVNVRDLAEREPMAAALLFHILGGAFDRETVERILAAKDESGRRFQAADGRWFLLDRGILRPFNEADTQPVIEHKIITPEEFHPRRDPDYAWFDAAVLDGAPHFGLRPLQTGDRMVPFGMKGSRLVSDILSDLKIPVDRKTHLRALTRNGQILWIPGIRAAALYPVTPSTRKILQLHIIYLEKNP